jgi:ABC-type glycerol-3-phosphate transport system substrate-binding protein
MSWRSHRFSRRRVIGAVGALGALGLLAACAQQAPAPTAAPPKPTEPPKPTAAAEAAAKPTAAPTKPAAEATKPAASPTIAAAVPAKPAETVEIRFGIHDDPDARKPILERFGKQYPNIKVTVEQIADFPVKIPTMAAAGTLPDVVRMWEAMILDMARAGQIIALDDRIKAQSDFNPDDFIKVFWDYPVVNGKRYGVADVMAPHFTLYNVDLLEKAGVPLPKADDSWTWDAYVAAAQKITRPNDKIWGSDTIPIGWQYWTAKMMWQNGGDFFSPDYQECVIDKPEAIETVDYWAALLLKGDLMPTPEQA